MTSSDTTIQSPPKFMETFSKPNPNYAPSFSPWQPPEAKKDFHFPPTDSEKIFSHNYAAWLKEKNAKIRVFGQLKKNEQILYSYIQMNISSDPINFGDKRWCRLTKHAPKEIGLSSKTISRLVKSIPLRKAVVMMCGKKNTLLRIAPPWDKTPEDYARIMAKEWESRIGKRPNKKEYGSLCGIAQEKDPHLSPDIFCTVIENWTNFMAALSVAIEKAKVEGDEFCSDPEKFYKIYLHYPSIITIRRFWCVAREIYVDLAMQHIESNGLAFQLACAIRPGIAPLGKSHQ